IGLALALADESSELACLDTHLHAELHRTLLWCDPLQRIANFNGHGLYRIGQIFEGSSFEKTDFLATAEAACFDVQSGTVAEDDRHDFGRSLVHDGSPRYGRHRLANVSPPLSHT